MEEQPSGQPSEYEKQGGAEKAQQKAAADRGEDGAPHGGLVAACVRFRHDGQKQYGDGVGDGGGKQNERQAHACEYTVDTQGIGAS